MIRSIIILAIGIVLAAVALVFSIWLHADVADGRMLSLFGMLADQRRQFSLAAALLAMPFLWVGLFGVARRRMRARQERLGIHWHR